MVYLVLSIVCSAMLSLIMRLSEERIRGKLSMLSVNYAMCTLIAGLYAGRLFPAGSGLSFALGMGAATGVLYLLSFLMLQMNIHRNGVVLSTLFMKLGLLVPFVVSILAFGEQPEPLHIAGFCLAIGAILLMNGGSARTATSFRVGLILLLLSGGVSDVTSKVFEQMGSPDYASQYLFYTFATALVLCTALTIWRRERPGLTDLAFGALIGIPNYFASRFLLMSLNSVPATIAYPTFSVGTILLVTLVGVGVFRERLSKRQWIAAAVILVALVLLNL